MNTDTPLFAAKNITKKFAYYSAGEGVPAVVSATQLTALDNINLDIYEGRCVVVAGSNGSGKTLLMKIIAGLLEPDSGEVMFRGEVLFDKKKPGCLVRKTEKKIRRELGLVFQNADAQIVGETVAEDAAFGPENLGFSKAETAGRVDAALAAFGLGEKRECSPGRLSGGEKRRLAVAGVIAAGCGTVIMDEPFANLDWPGIESILRVVAGLKSEGKTLIILTHELEKILAFADRLVVLHRGRICADDTPEAVIGNLDPAWGVRDPRRSYKCVKDCTWLEE